MQAKVFLAVLVGAIPVFTLAKDREFIPDELGSIRNVRQASAVANAHLRNFLEGNFMKMESTYAPRIVLLPGNEMLKSKYGLAGAKGELEPVWVDRVKLIRTMEDAFKGRALFTPEVIDKYFEMIKFEHLKTDVGDYATPPPDPIGTPDGKLHFAIQRGDILFKVGPEKGDFMLFQMREIDGNWAVVAEYLD